MTDRIAVLSVTHEPAYGAERVLANLLRGLPPELAERCVLVRPDGSGLARWMGDAPIPARAWSARRDGIDQNLRAAFGAARELREQGVCLVHAWGTRAFEPALLLAGLLPARVAGTLHDHPRAAFLGRARRLLLRSSAARLRPLVCVSDALAAVCRDAGLGRNLTVIRNGLPSLSNGSGQREHRGITRVGFFGLYARWKGFDIVREWIEQTDEEIEWHLYGELDPSLRTRAEQLRGRKSVVFHGWVEDAGAMEGIDVLLHASVEFDPYPTVLLEAARAGIPAVASDVGGAREIVEDGVTGFIYPPGAPLGLERLRQLAADAALRARMGAAARRKFAAEFGVKQMADAYVRLWGLDRSPA